MMSFHGVYLVTVLHLIAFATPECSFQFTLECEVISHLQSTVHVIYEIYFQF